MRRSNPEIAVVGPALSDQHVQPLGDDAGSKVLSRIWWSFGGFAFNVAVALAAAKKTGLIPVFILGKGLLTSRFKEEAGDRFREARFIEHTGAMRQSVIVHGQDKIYTTRTELALKTLPADVVYQLKRAKLVMVGPMTPEDHQLAQSILSTNASTILVLSREQLAQPEAAMALASAASWCILNLDEARLLAKTWDPVSAVQLIQAKADVNLVVTGPDEIVMRLRDGNWHCQPCFVPRSVSRTCGCGDVFTATLALGIATGADMNATLEVAAAAACRHAEGHEPADTATVRAWAERRTRKVSRTSRGPGVNAQASTVLAGIAAAFGTAAAILSAVLLA